MSYLSSNFGQNIGSPPPLGLNTSHYWIYSISKLCNKSGSPLHYPTPWWFRKQSHNCVNKNYSTLREEPSQINIILQYKLLAAKLRAVCTVYKQWLYVPLIAPGWLQLWLINRCKKTTGYYSIFQLSLLLLLNNYQYNCNNTISSVSIFRTACHVSFGLRDINILF